MVSSVQLYSLTSENKLLVEKLQYSGKSSSATMYNAGDTDDKELLINPTNNLAGATVKTSEDAVSLMKSVQAGTHLNICLLYTRGLAYPEFVKKVIAMMMILLILIMSYTITGLTFQVLLA